MKTAQKALAATFDRGGVALPAEGPILAHGLTPGSPLDGLPRAQSLLLEDFEPEVSRLAAQGWKVQPFPGSSQALRQNLLGRHGALARLALVIPGKQRQRALGDVALMAESLSEGGSLVLAVANDSGSGRAQGDLAALFGTVNQVSKHKSRVLWAQKGSDFDAALAASWIAAAQARALPLRRESPAVLTAPGLFAWDRLDAGSILLATHLPTGLRGAIADFGCGWGYLSAEVLARCPAITRLDAIDADARAVGLARRNLTDPRVCLSWADASQPGEKARWDAVVTNPPFHQGRRADPGLGRAFIRAAAHGLKPGGQLLLVANLTLPYEMELHQNFASWRSVAEAEGYKLLMAVR